MSTAQNNARIATLLQQCYLSFEAVGFNCPLLGR
jgi:hypothetical protein